MVSIIVKLYHEYLLLALFVLLLCSPLDNYHCILSIFPVDCDCVVCAEAVALSQCLCRVVQATRGARTALYCALTLTTLQHLAPQSNSTTTTTTLLHTTTASTLITTTACCTTTTQSLLNDRTAASTMFTVTSSGDVEHSLPVAEVDILKLATKTVQAGDSIIKSAADGKKRDTGGDQEVQEAADQLFSSDEDDSDDESDNQEAHLVEQLVKLYAACKKCPVESPTYLGEILRNQSGENNVQEVLASAANTSSNPTATKIVAEDIITKSVNSPLKLDAVLNNKTSKVNSVKKAVKSSCESAPEVGSNIDHKCNGAPVTSNSSGVAAETKSSTTIVASNVSNRATTVACTTTSTTTIKATSSVSSATSAVTTRNSSSTTKTTKPDTTTIVTNTTRAPHHHQQQQPAPSLHLHHQQQQQQHKYYGPNSAQLGRVPPHHRLHPGLITMPRKPYHHHPHQYHHHHGDHQHHLHHHHNYNKMAAAASAAAAAAREIHSSVTY